MENPGSSAIRNYLLFLCTVLVFAVSYYFVIALPQHDRAKIELEREKFQAEQKEKEKKESAEKEAKNTASFDAIAREVELEGCINKADSNYWTYVKLNGQEVENKPGTYTALQRVWDSAAKTKKAELDECHRRYGH